MKLIGIVFPEYNTCPPDEYVLGGITQFKSDKFQTSIYPPTVPTLKLVPWSLSSKTEIGSAITDADIGFL
jgi:hypothetical protein